MRQPVSIRTAGERIQQDTVDLLSNTLLGLGVTVCPTENEGIAITVVLTDDYLQPALAEVNQQQITRQQPWLLLKPLGSILWIGPVFRPEDTGCWHCLAQRLAGNREVETSVKRQLHAYQSRCFLSSTPANAGESIPHLPTIRAALPSTVQTAIQIASTEIAKYLVISGKTSLWDRVLTFNHHTLAVQSHSASRRPQCPTCGDPDILRSRGFAPIELQACPKIFTGDGGHRVLTPQQTLQRHNHLISPITGVVSELTRVTDPSNTLVHTYKSNHAFGSATSLRGLRSTLKHKSSGKGKTDTQSRASGLCEAVERYSGIYQGDEPRLQRTFAQLGSKAINPECCLCISDNQYLNREIINKSRQATHDWIPNRFDISRTLDWTPVWSLTEKTHKYLPTAFCYYDYPLSRDHSFCSADSNGNAAGNTLEEAILQGFFELVERDSVALWWYNRLSRPLVDLESFDDPYFQDLQQFYARNGRDLWVLDLTADLGIPTFAGVSRRRAGSSERLILGFGAHFDPTTAISRTLTEVNQIGLELDHIPDDELDSDSKNWLLEATLDSQPYLSPDPDLPVKTLQDYPRLWSEDIRDDIHTCVEIARLSGLETLVLDQTRPDIGLNVVKVIIPGLRHFWPRYAPGRLYNVPVAMGWLKTATPEEEMNPQTMPF
jgi:bacteriocin biosynthesis cyclodehydratase domain-containing protein